MPLRNPFATLTADDPRPAFSLSQLPTYLAWAIVGLVKSWWQTRRIGQLLHGLPAMVLAVVLAMLFMSSDQPVSSQTIDGYLTHAEQAANREAYDEAEFYFRKLEKVAPDDRKVIEKHAKLLARQEKYYEAFRMMEKLVNDDDKSNDVAIHTWLAETALEKDVGIEDPLEYAKSHLVAVLNENPQNLLAQYFFARLNLREGDIPNAIDHLEHVASRSAELQLLLASLYLQLSPPDEVRARLNARNAADVLRKTIQQTQTSEPRTYHQLAAARVIIDDFEAAVQTLRQALTKFDLEVTRQQLARTYVAWSEHVVRQDPENVGKQMQLLGQAMETAPNEPRTLQRLLEIASEQGPGAEEAETALRTALVKGTAPAAVHFSLGLLAAKRGDHETAIRHLKQSEQLNPRTAVTLNNLAYIMAYTPNADLEHALTMANQALEMAPNSPPFRDTRGQILTRLGRYEEAISDLEFANSRMDDPGAKMEIYRALATCYQMLGDTATAEAYQQQYEQLRSAHAQEAKPDDSEFVPPELNDVPLENPAPPGDAPAE